MQYADARQTHTSMFGVCFYVASDLQNKISYLSRCHDSGDTIPSHTLVVAKVGLSQRLDSDVSLVDDHAVAWKTLIIVLPKEMQVNASLNNDIQTDKNSGSSGPTKQRRSNRVPMPSVEEVYNIRPFTGEAGMSLVVHGNWPVNMCITVDVFINVATALCQLPDVKGHCY